MINKQDGSKHTLNGSEIVGGKMKQPSMQDIPEGGDKERCASSLLLTPVFICSGLNHPA